MGFSKRFSPRGGVWIVMICCVLLTIVIVPACSKKTGEETSPSGKVAASGSTKGGDTAEAQNKRQELIGQLKQIQGALILMQGVTLKKHPELLKEQESLKTMIDEKIKALLEAQNVDITELQGIQKKLQDQNLPKTERDALMQKFQAQATLSRQARVDAMQDAKVLEAYQKYEAHITEMMKADHDDAAEKIESFNMVQAELQKLEGAGR